MKRFDSSSNDSRADSEFDGRRIVIRLEEHSYREKFLATIIGPASIDDPYFEGTYLLKIEPRAAQKLSVDYIMFHPEFYDFQRTFLKRRDVVRESKGLGKPSLETFLQDPRLASDGLRGRVYTARRQDLIQGRTFRKNEFSVLAYGIITRAKS